MAKKELHHGVSFIPNLGEKQGSWYFPLKFLFTTLCAAVIIFAIGSVLDFLELAQGWKVMLIMVMVAVAILYLISAVLIFLEWWKNTKAIVDQEKAKSQILFLETYKKAKQLKPGAALYDETEWLHDLITNLKNKPEFKKEKK